MVAFISLQVLRFYRLFGPSEQNLPQLWRGAKKKRKKKRMVSGTSDDGDQPTSPTRKTIDGWNYNYAPTPPPEDCMPDEEVHKFVKAILQDVTRDRTFYFSSKNYGMSLVITIF